MRHFAASRPLAEGQIIVRLLAESAAEVGADLCRLIRCQFPARIGDALPPLIAEPLTDRSVADAQLGRKLLWGDRLGHCSNLVCLGGAWEDG